MVIRRGLLYRLESTVKTKMADQAILLIHIFVLFCSHGNGICMDWKYCPNHLPLIENTPFGWNCTSKCKEKEYIFGTHCLPICKTDQNEKDNDGRIVCAKDCPMSLLVTDGNLCNTSCPSNQVIDNGRCIPAVDCNGVVIEPRTCVQGMNRCPASYETFVYANYSGRETHGIRVIYYNDDNIIPGCRPIWYLGDLLFFCIACEGLLFVLLAFAMCNCRRNIATLCTCLRYHSPVSKDLFRLLKIKSNVEI